MKTLLHARLLIDGTGAPPLEDAAILIGADGRIEWVGPSAAAPRPETVRVVELGPTTLLPGLIDSHVHLSFDAGPDHAAVRAVLDDEELDGLLAARALSNAQMALLSGVTTLRDCGAKGMVVLRVGLADQVGTLKVGKRADVVCVEGNPLDDLDCLRQVRRVWRDGRVVVEDGRLAAPAVDDAR